MPESSDEETREDRAALDAIRGLNKRHQFVEQKFAITVSPAAAEFWYSRWRVFADARFSRVVDANDDHWLGVAAHDGRVSGIADVPIHARNVRSPAIKKILSVV